MAVKKQATEDKAVPPRARPRPKAGMVTVTVTGPGHLTHAGKLYKAGATVDLPAEVAAQLVAAELATNG